MVKLSKDQYIKKVLYSCKTEMQVLSWYKWAKTISDSHWDTLDYILWMKQHDKYLARLNEVGIHPKEMRLEPEEMT